MRLTWTTAATADRNLILDYIAADSVRAALAVDERIAVSVDRLRQFPRSGRKGRVNGTLELVMPNTPYVAVYAIIQDEVRILRVLHGARHWPDE